GQGTSVGFYSRTCPRVESIVGSAVRSHFASDEGTAPGVLRLHFHDCFIRGCDGSVLLAGNGTERTALPNVLLRGYEVIDDAKNQVEAACPGVVSCADVLAIAARDAVVLTGGVGWEVQKGRRDGRISLASETATLPLFTDSVQIQIDKFQARGLDIQDLVTLVGSHTIGITVCNSFRYRLYNFSGTGAADPTINPAFLPTLRSICPENGNGSRRVYLDQGSGSRFDLSFFRNVKEGKAVLESDQRLWGDASTRTLVERYLGMRGAAGLRLFDAEFARAMVKMGNIQLKTGAEGEIRRVCSSPN
ncbi:hypothetical protein M569_03364, partial [Genlisea aurea]